MNNLRCRIADPRIRTFLGADRILRAVQCSGCERWLSCQETIAHIPKLEHAEIFPDGEVLLDFGQELFGGIRIISNCYGRIRITFGESVSEALLSPDQTHCIHQTELEVPATGILEYGSTAFRFVRIENTGGKTLQLVNVLAVSLSHDLKERGVFASSDERLDRIWTTARHTLRLCMQEFIVDGGKRDKIVWAGDLLPALHTLMAAYGEPLIAEQSLDFLIRHTAPDDPQNGIYSYNCWLVIALHDFFLLTGKRDFPAKHLEYLQEMLRKLVSFIGPDGSERIPGFRFLDWRSSEDPQGIHAGLQGLLFLALQRGGVLLKHFGGDAGFLDPALARMRSCVPECGGNKLAAALQTLSGLADRRSILEQSPLEGVGTFGGFHILQAKNTLPALELIRYFWGSMLDRGATAFWEDWDLQWLKNTGRIDELPRPGLADLHADFGNYCYRGIRHSLCHVWASGPLPFLSRRISGIRFTEPGGTKVRFTPDCGDLEYARIVLPSVHGYISVELEKGLPPKLALPAGITLENE